MDPIEPLVLGDLTQGKFRAGDFGVLGDPIAHSLSPVMHQASLALLAPAHLALRGRRYHRLHIKPSELAEALAALRLIGAGGLNLTLPHKLAGLKLAQEHDATALDCGAANTLVPVPRGWRALNTDGIGFAEALAEKSGSGPEQRPIVILGAGGAARAITTACLRLGASAVMILNRTPEKAHTLAAEINDPRVLAGSLENPTLPPGAVVVNCTVLGLKADDPSPLGITPLADVEFIFDTTYGQHRSALLQAADQQRIPACDGRSMLRWQGALAFKAWTGILPPLRAMARALGEG